MKRRSFILLVLFPMFLSGCVVYFVDRPYETAIYNDPIEEPTPYPYFPPAPPPQPVPMPMLPPAGKNNPSPAKPAPQPNRPGSDLHDNRSGSSGTTTTPAPTFGRTTEPTNASTQQNTQPARTEGGRR